MKIFVLRIEHNLQCFSTKEKAAASARKWSGLGWNVDEVVEVTLDEANIQQHPLMADLIHDAAEAAEMFTSDELDGVDRASPREMTAINAQDANATYVRGKFCDADGNLLLDDDDF